MGEIADNLDGNHSITGNFLTSVISENLISRGIFVDILYSELCQMNTICRKKVAIAALQWQYKICITHPTHRLLHIMTENKQTDTQRNKPLLT